jgi:hypothetical protein
MHGRSFKVRGLLVLMSWALVASHGLRAQPAALHVSPITIALDNPEATQQILVRSAVGDLTRAAAYEVLEPKIVAVDNAGLVRATAEGRTIVVVRSGKAEARIPVEVTGM